MIVHSPLFPWDFRDSYASVELPPSWFVKANATWGECLYYRGERALLAVPLDCSQSPFFPWDLETRTPRSNSRHQFVKASATWGECLNYPGGP